MGCSLQEQQKMEVLQGLVQVVEIDVLVMVPIQYRKYL